MNLVASRRLLPQRGHGGSTCWSSGPQSVTGVADARIGTTWEDLIQAINERKGWTQANEFMPNISRRRIRDARLVGERSHHDSGRWSDGRVQHRVAWKWVAFSSRYARRHWEEQQPGEIRTGGSGWIRTQRSFHCRLRKAREVMARMRQGRMRSSQRPCLPVSKVHVT
jgi:hypothetical protein